MLNSWIFVAIQSHPEASNVTACMKILHFSGCRDPTLRPLWPPPSSSGSWLSSSLLWPGSCAWWKRRGRQRGRTSPALRNSRARAAWQQRMTLNYPKRKDLSRLCLYFFFCEELSPRAEQWTQGSGMSWRRRIRKSAHRAPPGGKDLQNVTCRKWLRIESNLSTGRCCPPNFTVRATESIGTVEILRWKLEGFKHFFCTVETSAALFHHH